VRYWLLSILPVLTWGSVPAGAGEPVAFTGEVIRVYVAADRVRVEGTYFFTNRTEATRSQPVIYPLPVDPLHPFPHEITVFAAGETLAATKDGHNVRFFLTLPPGRETSFVVDYEQLCLDSTACYIVTTTGTWRRPIDRAEFEIYVPEEIVLGEVTYAADATVARGKTLVYRFARRGFTPDRDLCLSWHRRGN